MILRIKPAAYCGRHDKKQGFPAGFASISTAAASPAKRDYESSAAAKFIFRAKRDPVLTPC
jgi:hypothetical protein